MQADNLSGQTTDDLHRKLEVQIAKKKKLEQELLSVEKKIYAYETLFLDDSLGKAFFRRPDGPGHRRERKVGINDYDRPFSMDLPK
ncbi:hypothetical protein NEHOM01_0918 [Nematocida homosporus]|uniref:uncharacterized protein n=1 Tax=Nematocida homosporus TaxID=1912981 RepID=UPI002220F076|nr:uncharacterized protein NEHOM01_0918 [Nematocida homosporus]KAI5185592.1 hypothetical protein NEHOM01_0918 [Nematocida homosporus]